MDAMLAHLRASRWPRASGLTIFTNTARIASAGARCTKCKKSCTLQPVWVPRLADPTLMHHAEGCIPSSDIIGMFQVCATERLPSLDFAQAYAPRVRRFIEACFLVQLPAALERKVRRPPLLSVAELRVDSITDNDITSAGNSLQQYLQNISLGASVQGSQCTVCNLVIDADCPMLSVNSYLVGQPPQPQFVHLYCTPKPVALNIVLFCHLAQIQHEGVAVDDALRAVLRYSMRGWRALGLGLLPLT